MCGRYTLTVIEGFEDFYEIDDRVHLQPRFNIAPTQAVPVILGKPSQLRTLHEMHWGLIPRWSDGPGPNPARLINARSETVHSRPSFREAFAQRRCLLPADGFYEWRQQGKSKIPLHFSLHDGDLFAFAGLWEKWRGAGDLLIESTSILTTEPNSLVVDVHDRMPVILTRERFGAWLDPDTPLPVLQGLMNPLSAREMRRKTVSTRVNNAREEGPELLQESPVWRQPGLF